jgi:hypothetical protein
MLLSNNNNNNNKNRMLLDTLQFSKTSSAYGASPPVLHNKKRVDWYRPHKRTSECPHMHACIRAIYKVLVPTWDHVTWCRQDNRLPGFTSLGPSSFARDIQPPPRAAAVPSRSLSFPPSKSDSESDE